VFGINVLYHVERFFAGRISDPLLIVDATLGTGGHADLLLSSLPCSKLLALDVDPDAIAFAQKSLKKHISARRVEIKQAKFSQLSTILGNSKVDLLFLDVGVSHLQLSRHDRGFNLQGDTLDMRMSKEGPTLLEFLEKCSTLQLESHLHAGGEKLSRPIARSIKAQIYGGKLKTPRDIRGICCSVYKYMRGKSEEEKATAPTMEGLCMALNDELNELDSLLRQIPGFMKRKSLFLCMAHTTEQDRQLKWKMREWQESGWVHLPNKKAVAPSYDEKALNPLATQAKFRVCEFL